LDATGFVGMVALGFTAPKECDGVVAAIGFGFGCIPGLCDFSSCNTANKS
jgi:hypothetical protein